MKRYQFTDDEYAKLSKVTGISIMDLQKLDSLGLLSNKCAVGMVFELEYRNMRKTTKVRPRLIIQAIANKYGISVDYIKRRLFMRSVPVYYCCRCNKQITALENKNNAGLCDKCMVSDIKL